jgi:hypothetical protein
MSGLRVNARPRKAGGHRKSYLPTAFARSQGPSEKAALSICASIFDHLSAAIGEPIALRS